MNVDNTPQFRRDVHLEHKPVQAPEYQSLYALLYQDSRPRKGMWIPAWVSSYCITEASAMVLGELLWWCMMLFGNDRQAKQIGIANLQIAQRARARVRFSDGKRQQWLAISVSELAAYTMLSESAVADALLWAEKVGLLVGRRHDDAQLRIRLIGRAAAHAFQEMTKFVLLPEVHRDADLASGWKGSFLHRMALHFYPGTTVHNALLVALRGDHFLARLLSQIVFQFADDEGNCSADFISGGYRWWETSDQQIATELGVSLARVQHGLDVLETFGPIHTLSEPKFLRSQGRQREVIFLRPDVPLILDAVQKAKKTKSKENVNAVSK